MNVLWKQTYLRLGFDYVSPWALADFLITYFSVKWNEWYSFQKFLVRVNDKSWYSFWALSLFWPLYWELKSTIPLDTQNSSTSRYFIIPISQMRIPRLREMKLNAQSQWNGGTRNLYDSKAMSLNFTAWQSGSGIQSMTLLSPSSYPCYMIFIWGILCEYEK